ncbi:MAG: rhodanese-like domain-containing protein [Cyclobacteriaceae bacterium]
MESLYEHTVPLIDAEELESKLSADLIILDIRSPKEFEISHIQGAQLISYENFKKSDVKFIDKNQEVIVYCSVGYRSERIGEKLQNMGFKNVKNLYGGIFDWKNNGKIIVNNKSTSTDSVHTYNEDWSQWLYKGVKVYE